jgi:hypothetical protein
MHQEELSNQELVAVLGSAWRQRRVSRSEIDRYNRLAYLVVQRAVRAANKLRQAMVNLLILCIYDNWILDYPQYHLLSYSFLK